VLVRLQLGAKFGIECLGLSLIRLEPFQCVLGALALRPFGAAGVALSFGGAQVVGAVVALLEQILLASGIVDQRLSPFVQLLGVQWPPFAAFEQRLLALACFVLMLGHGLFERLAMRGEFPAAALFRRQRFLGEARALAAQSHQAIELTL